MVPAPGEELSYPNLDTARPGAVVRLIAAQDRILPARRKKMTSHGLVKAATWQRYSLFEARGVANLDDAKR